MQIEKSGVCVKCGSALAAGDDVRGTCPRCMLEWAFGDEPGDTRARPEPREVAAVEEPELRGQFGPYAIEGLLGRGGMGVVYLARHTSLDRRVAVKVLPESLARDEQFTERFQREARAMASLAHPNIVSIHDFGCIDGRYYFAMEFVDGGSLRGLLEKKSLSSQQALAIIPQICDALQYAHRQGVVHRDIKPENILIDRAGAVKIADFGLAKVLGSEASGNRHLTRSDHIVGTLHYMAPEQFERPKQVDHRADIYSLGVVFYEMLTGELPLGRFDPPSHRSGVNARLDEVVLRSLEKQPERRFQHASELKAAAARCEGLAPEPPARRWAGSRIAAAVAGFLIAIAVPALLLQPSADGASGGASGVSWPLIAAGLGLLLLFGLGAGIRAALRARSVLGCLALAGGGVCAAMLALGLIFFTARSARMESEMSIQRTERARALIEAEVADLRAQKTAAIARLHALIAAGLAGGNVYENALAGYDEIERKLADLECRPRERFTPPAGTAATQPPAEREEPKKGR